MSNFIEELYYGNIDPQARGYRPKSPIKKETGHLPVSAKINRNAQNQY